MNIKKHFSLDRFYKYLKYDATLNGKMYLFFLLGLCVILFFVDFFALCISRYSEYFTVRSYNKIFGATFLIGGIILVGVSFPSLRTSNKSVSFLLIPVSIFEKFIVQFIFRILLFSLLILPIHWLVFKVAYGFYHLFTWDFPVTLSPYNLLSPIGKGEQLYNTLGFIMFCLMVFTLMFAGAISFKKYAFFKSILTFALIMGGFFLTMIIFSHLFYSHGHGDFFEIKLRTYEITSGVSNIELYTFIMSAVIALLLVFLAYFKLKEREV